MTPSIEPRSAPLPCTLKASAAAVWLLSNAACFLHVVQPQTYYLATRHVEQQRREYLDKELLAGLPEPLFLRWYTRDVSWGDSLRPYILKRGTSAGRTVYKVGTGGRGIADVYFGDGRLEEVGKWGLVQEGVLSAWFYRKTTPPQAATNEILERLWRLDPAAEPLRPEEAKDARGACPFDRGSLVESMEPLEVVRAGKGLPHLTNGLRSMYGGTATAGTLSAGKELIVLRWGILTNGLLMDVESGQKYWVRAFPMAGAFCPRGLCAPVGEVGVLTRDLKVASIKEGDRCEALAFAPGLTRIPVWAERLGLLETGSLVRIRSWSPCGNLQAELEILSPGNLPDVVRVPVAPPGLFAPMP